MHSNTMHIFYVVCYIFNFILFILYMFCVFMTYARSYRHVLVILHPCVYVIFVKFLPLAKDA
jgi:hypothetical protein